MMESGKLEILISKQLCIMEIFKLGSTKSVSVLLLHTLGWAHSI